MTMFLGTKRTSLKMIGVVTVTAEPQGDAGSEA